MKQEQKNEAPDREPGRRGEDVTWFDDRLGARLDVIGGRIEADGRMSATAVRLVIVSRSGDALDELPIPATLGAEACLELAAILMAAASAIDPARVRGTITRCHHESEMRWALQQPLPDGVATH